ncbi:tetratricopeptide repeat protein, partial [Candidatus Dependentiae bacterium]|nr:tetratricopeptide repeat protein [Candidatus Dependentiae bacterium]
NRHLAKLNLVKGKELQAKDNSKAAINYLKEAGKRDDTSYGEEANFIMAEIFYKNKRYSTALALYKKVLKNDKYFNDSTYDQDDEAIVRIALIYIKQDNPKKALEYLESFETEYPNSKNIANAKKLIEIAQKKLNQ